MSLVLSTGSNLGNREKHINDAKVEITKHFNLIFESTIYESPAVDYTNQGKFLNQVLELSLPETTPSESLKILLQIENEFGRVRNIDKGPRTLDIDILFWGLTEINDENLQVPHPRQFDRSFIILPLKEIPYFKELSKHFSFSNKFNNEAWPYNP